MLIQNRNTLTQVEMQRQMPFAYWLAAQMGIGNKTISLLLRHFKTPESIYYATREQLESVLKDVKKVQILSRKKKWNLYTEYESLEKKNIMFCPQFSPLYPKKLLQIPDAPFAIYVKGRLPDESAPSVAIIGARICSEYGRRMAREFGTALAQVGIQVISGMARGIDGISQKAAIEGGGSSYGVLGCGVDICYPLENIDLYESIMEKGGILSEYVPGTMPKPSLFPPRNRIISGLADIVLVIEARQKSGTLITVDMALEQGREVYALPGRVGDMLSTGCNRLIGEGAGIVLSTQDFIERIAGKCYHSITPMYNSIPISACEKEKMQDYPQSKLLECIDYYPKTWETIWEQCIEQYIEAKETAPSHQELMQELMELELEGAITQRGGSFYKR